MGIDRRSGVGGERVGIDRRSGVGEGEIGDRQEWMGRGLGGSGDRRSGVGWGERGDRQEDRGGRGREWG